jgi:hypothetical protein
MFFTTTRKNLDLVFKYLSDTVADNPSKEPLFAVDIHQSSPFGLSNFDDEPVEFEVKGDVTLFESLFSFEKLDSIQEKEGFVNKMGELIGDLEKCLQSNREKALAKMGKQSTAKKPIKSRTKK